MFHVLEYDGLDTHGIESAYRKTLTQLRGGDWRSAKVKKLHSHPYYRAELNSADRLVFQPRTVGGTRCLLVLEIVRQHAYDKSRFLRGAEIDESKLPELAAAAEPDPALHLPIEVGARSRFHLLDKVLLFDETQEAVLGLAVPLVIVGSAGSGKTALTLTRMKSLEGDVLYTTQSAFLAEHARNLYYAHGFEAPAQRADFLSLRELVETLRVAPGRELRYADFRDFARRHAQAIGKRNAHMIYEEFRGVLVGTRGDCAWLDREQYLALGVKQSIFPPEERAELYALFEKYREWLAASGLYDTSITAQQYLPLATPRYDFLVIDEVQDMTIAQLTLCMALLRKPGQFLLCGDANQIVHPNFFSWGQVKTLFWRDPELAQRAGIQVLHANYRNAPAVNALANRLIMLKQRRFGSIDRESNYLVRSGNARDGVVALLADDARVKRELDEKTRLSARYAVLVLREEDKAEARRFFRTPLVFSVQEAKGLEYEHAILFNLVSGARAEFAAIAAGIDAAELEGDALAYARAKDKSDKSLEVYKFFINSLYVAMTRAVSHLYLIEADARHPLLGLLKLDRLEEKLELAQTASSAEEWQREARRLEMQGRQEQADAIRRDVLQQKTVPWQVYTPGLFAETLGRFEGGKKDIPGKQRQQLQDYAAFYREPYLFARLCGDKAYDEKKLDRAAYAVTQKYAAGYAKPQFRDVLAQVDQYGVDFRNAFHATPLMLAAQAGNVDLVAALIERGADPNCYDNYGRNAFQLFLGSARTAATWEARRFAGLYRALAPSSVSLRYRDRLYKLDAHTIEFVLYNLIVATFKHAIHDVRRRKIGIDSAWLAETLAAWPASVLSRERHRRDYLNGVLARNEVRRPYAYNRKLLLRMRMGEYVLNPWLDVRIGEEWVAIGDLLALNLCATHSDRYAQSFLHAVENLRQGDPPPEPDASAPSGTEPAPGAD